MSSRGTLPIASQRSWTTRRAARAASGSRRRSSRPRRAAPLGGGVRVELGVALGEVLRPAGEEGVLRGAEALPQARRRRPSGRARGLPLVIRSRKRAAVGPSRRSRRASPPPAPAPPCAPAHRPAAGPGPRSASLAAVERLTRLGEPLPQQLVGLAVDAADRAPLVEDRLEPVARLLPLRRLGRQRLGLRGQGLLARDGGDPRASRSARCAPRPARPASPGRRAARQPTTSPTTCASARPSRRVRALDSVCLGSAPPDDSR
jgi:hypothetical protein